MSPETQNQFGTVKGVYIPSVLTIFGVIMYLRMGWMVAHVGLWGSFAVISLASVIIFLTALSISASATSMKVGGGGAYYMISRSFGIETGAAIGIPLFFAQALGISFYISGFAESVVNLYPALTQTHVAMLALLGLALLTLWSADLALKIQSIIFALILASLVSFFMGNPSPEVIDGLRASADDPGKAESFWGVFAVIFPAVTGIEAGLALSGDLKNPAKALPLGTLAAVGSGFLVYLAIPWKLHHTFLRDAVLLDPLIMYHAAAIGGLILLGLWGSTLSSALGALLGAPRTLQALAKDRVLPGFLAQTAGKKKEPRMATLVSLCIAGLGIWMGDLNAIATLLTMFFLTSYGFLNLAAALEALMANPSYRPTFKVPWICSLLGSAGCLMAMLMINAGATIVATILVILIFLWTKKRKLGKRWSDMRSGLLQSMARYAIYKLEESDADAKTWRPNVLALSGSPSSRWYLVEFAGALVENRGFLTVSAILVSEKIDEARAEKMERSIRDYLKNRGIPALAKVYVDEEITRGFRALMRAYGIGPIAPNTVLMGESEDGEALKAQVSGIFAAWRLNRNVLILRKPPELPDPDLAKEELTDEIRIRKLFHGKSSQERRVIDVWWGRQYQNANLMLVLAYLLRQSSLWRDADIRLRSVLFPQEDREKAEKAMASVIENINFSVQLEFLELADDENIFELIRRSSQDTDLLMLGIRPPGEDEEKSSFASYHQSLMDQTRDFPFTLMVMAGDEIQFKDILGD